MTGYVPFSDETIYNNNTNLTFFNYEKTIYLPCSGSLTGELCKE